MVEKMKYYIKELIEPILLIVCLLVILSIYYANIKTVKYLNSTHTQILIKE